MEICILQPTSWFLQNPINERFLEEKKICNIKHKKYMNNFNKTFRNFICMIPISCMSFWYFAKVTVAQCIVWYLNLYLPMQSLRFASWTLFQGKPEVYRIQSCVTEFVSFHGTSDSTSPNKVDPPWYRWNIVESGIKHQLSEY